MIKPALMLPAGLLALVGFAVSLSGASTPPTKGPFAPIIPKTWDDVVMADLELPLAHAPASPKHASADVRERRKVEIGIGGCVMCHTRGPFGGRRQALIAYLKTL